MDQEKFENEIVTQYPLLHSVAMRMLRDSEEASDAVQEAMKRLWERREGLDSEQNIKAYCQRAVRNICIDKLRTTLTDSIDSAMTITSAESSDANAEYASAMLHLRESLRRLPENQRRALYLNIFRDCDTIEICEITGFSADNVRQLLRRGRRMLRNIYAKEL